MSETSCGLSYRACTDALPQIVLSTPVAGGALATCCCASLLVLVTRRCRAVLVSFLVSAVLQGSVCDAAASGLSCRVHFSSGRGFCTSGACAVAVSSAIAAGLCVVVVSGLVCRRFVQVLPPRAKSANFPRGRLRASSHITPSTRAIHARPASVSSAVDQFPGPLPVPIRDVAGHCRSCAHIGVRIVSHTL